MTEAAQPADAVPQFSFKKRSAKAKANFRKKPDTPPPASDSDSDFTSSDDEEGRRIKRRRKNTGVVAASSASTSTATRNVNSDEQSASAAPVPISSTNDATKHSNWYDDDELTPQNLLGSTRARGPTSSSAAATPSVAGGAGPSVADGTYKGSANYSSFIQKNPNAPNKTFGPMKAATNVRTVTVMDFAPDVCKDWKQTGFCGFGDSCKFLHAREDYKQGWELDREWEISTKGKQLTGRVVSTHRKDGGKTAEDAEGDDEDDDELLESIPFACIICKKPYRDPIITKCGHYFCESCALQRYRKNPSCAACGAGTGGVFNVAKKLTRLLERKRERARKRREEAIAQGEEVSSDEEGNEGEEQAGND